MNRRTFFKGLLALPVVAALAPLLPARPRFPSARAIVSLHRVFGYDAASAFTRKEDISELLFVALRDTQALSVVRGMPMEGNHELLSGAPVRFLWQEDA